jgi:hypothetical protein
MMESTLSRVLAIDPSLPLETQILQASLLPLYTQALATVTRMNIPDLLAEGSRSIEEIAEHTDSNPQALYRVMRFLAGQGVFHEEDQRYFALTPLGETLQANKPDSPRGWLLFYTSFEWRWQLYQTLDKIVQTGDNGYLHLFDKPIYQVFTENPAMGHEFNLAMQSWSATIPEAILRTYDFTHVQKIVDVGGGRGHLLLALAKAHPHLRGEVLELPHVAQEANEMFQQAEVADRCHATAGDFFKAVPKGGDLYLIASVLMDWTDEQVVSVLQTCRRAMKPESKVLIIDPLIGDTNEPSLGKIADLVILMETTGVIRSEEEYRVLLERAGFDLTHNYETRAVGMHLLEAVPREG